MPGLTVKQVPVSAIQRYERNPRKNDQAVAAVARAIAEFGWRQPIVVDRDMVIVAGDTRYLAALELGQKKVPVHQASDLTRAQAKAWRIADNKVGELAEWDEALLALEFADLEGLDFDLSDTAFTDADIGRVLRAGGLGRTDPDDVPEAPTEAVTRPGDLIRLGAHRLVCGDATLVGAVMLLLDGASPRLMVTDPPYGVQYDPAWRARAGVNKSKDKMGRVSNDDRGDWREAWALFPGDVAYCWHASIHTADVQLSLEAAGFDIRSQIIWAKDRFALSRRHYHWQHEPCWYAVRKKAHWVGGRSQSTLWNIPAREDNGHGHGTQKPVECMRRPIENNSAAGEVVYDPFLGTGTTLIAAEMEGRVCYGMDIDPVYCDVAIKRWEEFTGQKAVRGG